MSIGEWSIDILLGLTLIWLGGFALMVRSATDAILGFIAFGMLMALVWLRLGSTDLAIAEAALGGGITGALLLSAQRRLMTIEIAPSALPTAPLTAIIRNLLITALVLGLTLILGLMIMQLPATSGGLAATVAEHLEHSGVRAEVTAVLLNFRGYDTMLELSVLLAALLGVWHLNVYHLPQLPEGTDPVLSALVRILVPVMIVVTGYVLWLGGHAAGGAFQAGALLAGAGVLMMVTQSASIKLKNNRGLRLLIVAGPTVFTTLGLWMAWYNGALLEYPRKQAGALILVIELASTFSIGITLLLLFVGGRPSGRRVK